MSLISLGFLILVIGTCLIYFIVPKKLKQYQWVVLLASSAFFYVFTCKIYSVYIVVTIATTYLFGRLLQRQNVRLADEIKQNKESWTPEQKKSFKAHIQSNKKWLVAAVLILNFGILAAVKYLDFIFTGLNSILSSLGSQASLPILNIIMPLGISFYTFQAMGYIIDIYRKKTVAETNFGRFALFVSFFPQIIQGPIGNYNHLAPQLYAPHKFDFERFKSGAILILWGLFKKVVIADRAVSVISAVCENYTEYNGAYYVLTVMIYAVQLYTDFSGGIDICRGIAEVLGIEMAENFKRPYLSKTLTEYWHRWHITLGDWLRNYLFYPISLSKPFLKMGKGLKKVNKTLGKVLPTAIASLITFIVIGIWHGADMKYVAFGVWNGGVIMISSLMQNVDKGILKKLHINPEHLWYKIFAIIRTMFFVLIGYYFDIATGFNAAMEMIVKSFTDFRISGLSDYFYVKNGNFDVYDFVLIAVCTLFILVMWIYEERTGKSIRSCVCQKSIPVQWILMLLLVVFIMIFGVYGPDSNPASFVYMQF